MASQTAATYTPHDQDPTLLEAFRYISHVPGKDIRGKLIDAFQRWFKIPNDKVTSIKDLVAELHNASLLIDDIEDNSHLRRGIPVAHEIYGVPTTINCANYVYFLALERCHRLGNTAAMNVFVLELLNLHRGQGQDIVWRDNLRCPTEEEYERMVLDKTGGLFRLAVGLMQAFCGDDNPCKSQDFTPLVDKLALYFQIRDDLINLASADYMTSKSFCEDLTEGKFSFPIIHTIRSHPNDTQLLNILKKRTESIPVKQYAVEHMEKCGSFAYTQERLQRLHAEVLESIDAMGGHAELSPSCSTCICRC
jgi:geranylgeranyl diphosphate synthase type 3